MNNQNSRNLQFLNAEEETNKLVISQLTIDIDDGVAITHETSIGCNPILINLTAGSKVMINGNQFTLHAAVSAGATAIAFTSTTLTDPVMIGDKIVIDKENLFQQYQFKTEGTVAGFTVDSDGLEKGGVEITGWLDSDTMTGATANNVPTAESVKAYVDNNAGGTSNYGSYKCSATTSSSSGNGEGFAVVIQYDSIIITSSPTTISLEGSSGPAGLTGGEYSWSMSTSGNYKVNWMVGTNTDVVNNRLLSGVKLQLGTSDGSAITWADIEPTHCYIYDRGSGVMRKGSTSGSIILRHSDTSLYYRAVLWKEKGTNGSTTAITLLNATNLSIEQL